MKRILVVIVTAAIGASAVPAHAATAGACSVTARPVAVTLAAVGHASVACRGTQSLRWQVCLQQATSRGWWTIGTTCRASRGTVRASHGEIWSGAAYGRRGLFRTWAGISSGGHSAGSVGPARRVL